MFEGAQLQKGAQRGALALNLRDWKKRPFRMWVLAGLLRAMSWIGIRTDLLILELEGQKPFELAQPTNGYDFRFLTPADIEDLIRLEPGTKRENLKMMFREGKLCYGVWDNTRLIAKMWCDLDQLYHPTRPHPLAADEVYLFLAYVDSNYRGQGLAPLMRVAGYASLREIGRSKFYSYSRYFNTAARRFKAKLGAREESLTVHFRLFGKWSRSLTFQRRN